MLYLQPAHSLPLTVVREESLRGESWSLVARPSLIPSLCACGMQKQRHTFCILQVIKTRVRGGQG